MPVNMIQQIQHRLRLLDHLKQMAVANARRYSRTCASTYHREAVEFAAEFNQRKYWWMKPLSIKDELARQ